MKKTKAVLIALLFLFLSVIISQNSQADEIDMVSPGQADLLNEPGLGQAVSHENLSELTGRQEIDIDNFGMQIVNSDQRAEVNNNSIFNSTIANGANSIGDNAFSNASGFLTVIQNSGNQVLIQNDLIMNLTVK